MASLSDKLASITHVPTPQSPGSAGFIQAFAGSTAPAGWSLCDGAVLEQADYSDLYSVLGSTWDSFAHPVDGTPTVGGSQFALPNLKGLYLSMAGDAGGDSRTLGVYQADATNTNGLGSSTGTNTAMNFRIYEGVTAGSEFKMQLNAASSKSNGAGYTDGQVVSTNTHTHTISSTDAETRPKTAPINYIIKLYSDKTNAISVGVAEATSTTAGTAKTSGAADSTEQYLIPNYQTYTLSLSSDGAQNMTGDIVFIKIGNTVTFTSDGTITHDSSNTPVSTSAIPADFRPSSNIYNTYRYSETAGFTAIINSAGTISLQYRDETTTVNQTSTSTAITGSYNII